MVFPITAELILLQTKTEVVITITAQLLFFWTKSLPEGSGLVKKKSGVVSVLFQE